ncbi:MAG: glycosyltransferase family 2 protein [Thiohalospira sp.]
MNRGARTAAVIPAFNEARTIREVVQRTREQLEEVIVVDDASSDGTLDQLRDLPVTVLRNEANRGKGASLWRGMEVARERGASAIVTLDGDAQHRPEAIPDLLAAAAERPDAIIIAARLLHRESAPRARLFANRFADFWISWAAGRPIRDTQSGFRLYPASLLPCVALPLGRGRGFVFESEILIEASRRGFPVYSVPTAMIHLADARPSHFRPVVDIARIVRMVAWKLLVRGLDPPGLVRSLRRPEVVGEPGPP